MATTLEGRQITEAHRRAQLQLRAATLRDTQRIWGAFDLSDISRSWPSVETGLVSVIEARGAQSAELTTGYYEAFRSAERVRGVATPRTVSLPGREELVTSLRFTGPQAARRLLALNRTDVASSVFAGTAGNVARLTLNQGRGSLLASVDADRQALGWIRVTDGSPCAFCAMLAGRGPVFRSQATAGFDAHNKCGCTAEAVYSRNTVWPGQASEYRQLWKTSTKGVPSSERTVAFRRAYEGRSDGPRLRRTPAPT